MQSGGEPDNCAKATGTRGKILFGGVWGDAAVALQGIGVNGGGSKSQTSCGVLGSNSVGVFGVAPVGVRGCKMGETGSMPVGVGG